MNVGFVLFGALGHHSVLQKSSWKAICKHVPENKVQKQRKTTRRSKAAKNKADTATYHWTVHAFSTSVQTPIPKLTTQNQSALAIWLCTFHSKNQWESPPNCVSQKDSWPKQHICGHFSVGPWQASRAPPGNRRMAWREMIRKRSVSAIWKPSLWQDLTWNMMDTQTRPTQIWECWDVLMLWGNLQLWHKGTSRSSVQDILLNHTMC